MLEEIKKKHSIKIGLLPVYRNFLSVTPALESKKRVEDKLKAMNIDYVNIDFLNKDGLMLSGLDAECVANAFIKEKVDAIFALHCNFGVEDAVAKVAKRVKKPVLVWGERDGEPDANGLRDRDTQCGMFATSKALQRLGTLFTYITNSFVDDEVFKKGFRNFLSAAAIVKAMTNLRIGQIGTRPAEFWSVMCNEGELLEKFGIETVPMTIVELIKKMKDIQLAKKTVLNKIVEEIKNRLWKFENISDEQLLILASLKVAIMEWVKEQGISALGVQCWPALKDALKLCNCMINGELAADGIPVGCEMDLHGAISSIMLQAAAHGEEPVFFADLTIRHPENDNAELLWHCGNFPHTIARQCEINGMKNHYNMNLPGAAVFEIERGDVTIARFDGDRGTYKMLMGQGKGVRGPYNWGTYMWMEVNDWPMWEEKFIYGPYIHHCAGIHGKYAPALYEACKYIPELIPDAIDPNENEIRNYLRR